MNNNFKRITCLMISFLTIGCSSPISSSSASNSSKSSSATSGRSSSSSAGHQHRWSNEWTYDENNHWKTCTNGKCDEVNEKAAHTFSELQDIDPDKLQGIDKYAYSNPKAKVCTCGYYKDLTGTNLLPELRFTFDKNDPDADFATKAKKDDISRPEVQGTITITNCPDEYKISKKAAGMKVRGNQTAGWSKKGFRIKFDKKQNLFGLNGGPDGKGFKKWILLADAKDTCLVRTALGLYVSQAVIKDGDNVWYSKYTPVTVYLNDEYWGFYYLCEQKEVKAGRVNLPEPEEGYTGTDIGYCFELDYYAADERKKGADADATFDVTYSPKMVTGNVQGALPPGGVKSYTLLSDITDGPGNVATTESNSKQVAFIKNKVESLYTILYEAAVNKVAKEIDENGKVVTSSKTVQEVMTQYFNLESWAAGVIINAFTCPPDLGYSSFYMAYDNSSTGDKKLRFDVPWDFDSNFGNRNNFNVNADQLYVDVTHNMWLQLLMKLDFFVNQYVKVRWQTLMQEKAFDGMMDMMKKHFADNDAEIKRNHYKWPQNDAAHQPPNNFDEIREPYKDPARYKDAEQETISWCTKRVTYLNSKWGK